MDDPGERTARQVGLEDGNLVLDLFVLQQRIGALLDEALTGTGVRPAEYAVYSQLGIDAMSPGEITARLGVTPSTLTGHLAAIEARGHLHRETDPGDRRSRRLVLTSTGRRALEDCRQRFKAAVDALYAELQVDPAEARDVLREVDRAAERVMARD
ncbi:MAG TPA: MarR family transcriptional regulator [Marmoricola sp.]|nr:MarR family transcriptional regulator [Marmoricola sp.]